MNTPRTDERTYPANCLGQTPVVHAAWAQALERDLAALLRERDQWRECAEALVKTYNEGVIYEHSEALARFDRLKAQEVKP